MEILTLYIRQVIIWFHRSFVGINHIVLKYFNQDRINSDLIQVFNFPEGPTKEFNRREHLQV